MNLTTLLVLLILWPMTVSSAELSGEALLERSKAAYASLTSYIGASKVKSEYVMNGALFTQSAMAKVTFLSPDRIRIEGKDSSGKAFTILSDAGFAWLSWEFKNRGVFEQAESLEMAVASITGVAAGAPSVIPAALMKFGWGSPFSRIGSVSEVVRDKVSGIDCYKVSVSQPERSITYWLDVRSYLLRQMKEEQDEKQTAEMQRMMQKLAGEALKEKGIPIPKFEMTSMAVVHSFTIDRINVPVDPQLFHDPTEK